MTAQDAASRNDDSTLEQPGVKAPGTAKRTPLFPLKSWSIATLFPGSPSWTSTAGSDWPACWKQQQQFQVQEKKCGKHVHFKREVSRGNAHPTQPPWRPTQQLLTTMTGLQFRYFVCVHFSLIALSWSWANVCSRDRFHNLKMLTFGKPGQILQLNLRLFYVRSL